MIIRIMTYNVHSCIGMDGRCSPERTAETIAQFGPDIVALQELDMGRNRTNGEDQARIIAEVLEMHHHFYPTIQVQEESYGDAVLSRYPMRTRKAALLPAPQERLPREPRGAIWVTLKINGKDLQIINTHLGLGKKERILQARELAGRNWLKHTDCSGPRILCGDLNAGSHSKAYRSFLSDLRDVQKSFGKRRTLRTWPSRFPLVRIDHLFVSSHFTIKNVIVSKDKNIRTVSDHLPLIADLEFSGAEITGTSCA